MAVIPGRIGAQAGRPSPRWATPRRARRCRRHDRNCRTRAEVRSSSGHGVTKCTAQQQQTAAGGGPIVSLVIAVLWSASGFINGFMNASNVVYDVPEGRADLEAPPVRLGVTTIDAHAVGQCGDRGPSGDIARQVGELIRWGDTGGTAWNIPRGCVIVHASTILRGSCTTPCPNAKPAGSPWSAPGGIFAAVIIQPSRRRFAFWCVWLLPVSALQQDATDPLADRLSSSSLSGCGSPPNTASAGCHHVPNWRRACAGSAAFAGGSLAETFSLTSRDTTANPTTARKRSAGGADPAPHPGTGTLRRARAALGPDPGE